MLKDLSKELFLDFFGEPLDGPRRKQPGVYSSIYLEGNGTRVSTILLDNR